ncbi:MAG: Rieske (2Fe-2S) protein [Nanoarchaeota archaeon]
MPDKIKVQIKEHFVAFKKDIPNGEGRPLEVEGVSIALFNLDGKFFALSNTCLHEGGPIGEGSVDDSTVTCPWHGWQYDVKSGNCLTFEGLKLKSYKTKVVGEKVFVSLD